MKALRQFFRGFRSGVEGFGSSISTLVNSILLFAVYLIGVGATSVFAKIVGKTFLDAETPGERETYWSEPSPSKKPIEEYYRQF